jgi:hypothetical protein
MPSSSLVVYEWRAWERYLIQKLFPNALRLQAEIDDTTADIVSSCRADTTTFLFHVNLSRTRRFPPCRDSLIELLNQRTIRVLNGEITDVTKRHISETCKQIGVPTPLALREGDPAETLIAKTNCNYGANSERTLDGANLDLLEIAPPPIEIGGPLDYWVLQRSDVPHSFWDNPAVQIERFITNPDGCFARSYVAGRARVISLAYSPENIKKMVPGIRRENFLCEGHDNGKIIRTDVLNTFLITNRVAEALNLDYGTLDFVFDAKGNAFLVDVNTTPFWGSESQDQMARHLRHGLEMLIA